MKRVLLATSAVLMMVAVVLVTGIATAAAADWTPTPGAPLAQPPQLLPGTDGVVRVTLVANASQPIRVGGAELLGVMPFTAGLMSNPGTPAATLDGPTIHVRPGGTIQVTFLNFMTPVAQVTPAIPGQNAQAGLTNIHYHGLHVAPNGTSDNIFRTFPAAPAIGQPTTSYSTVHVPLNQPVGTYWYHVHNADSALQVFSGLSGLLIIDPIQAPGAAPTYPLPAPWQKVVTRQLELRDVQTDSGAITENPICIGSTRLLNAQYEPRFTMQSNRWELWRLANIGTNVYYDVGLSDGRPPVTTPKGGKFYHVPLRQFHVVGEDGLPVWKTRVETALVMPPGKRYDVLVRIPNAGSYKLLSIPYAQQAQAPKTPGPYRPEFLPVTVAADGCGETAVPTTDVLGAVTVAAASGPVTPAATPPVNVSRVDNLGAPGTRIAQHRTFVFEQVDGNWKINGESFSVQSMPLADPLLNTVEEWRLVNTSVSNHPFHIHIQGFQLMSIGGGYYPANGHQDTVNIPRAHYDTRLRRVIPGEVVIRQRFTDFTGWFVFHCHILYHEDNGMMAIVQVRANASVRPTPPPPDVLNPPNMPNM